MGTVVVTGSLVVHASTPNREERGPTSSMWDGRQRPPLWWPQDERLAGHDGDDLLVGEVGRTEEFIGGPGFDTCVVEGPEHAKGHNLSRCEEVVTE
jgi:hypothetical protein